MKRAQVHTLEAVVGAFLLLASLTFAIQMTAVTPLSASTSSQHVENQLQASAEGVLADATEAGDLERALLYFDSSPGQFHNTSGNRYYTSKSPPNEFGETLRRAFDTRGIAYNVYVHYRVGNGRQSVRMVYRGGPSDNAVRATRTVLLVDNQTLLNETGSPRTTTIDGSNYFAPDMAPDSPVYNVLTVEVVVWRI
ncbi:MAG: hypothetical protein V5A43_05825 [Haloarculaceae archaeon]